MKKKNEKKDVSTTIRSAYLPLLTLLQKYDVSNKLPQFYAAAIELMSKQRNEPVIYDENRRVVARKCAYYGKFFTCRNIVSDNESIPITECWIAERSLRWSRKMSVIPSFLNSYSVEGYAEYLKRREQKKTLAAVLAAHDEKEVSDDELVQWKRERVKFAQQLKDAETTIIAADVEGFDTREECVKALQEAGCKVSEMTE